MNGKSVRQAPRDALFWIEEDADAVFDAAIRDGVLSEDPQHANFVGHYMYMHHDGDGTAWFKHRETRDYVNMPPACGSTDRGGLSKRLAAPGKALWGAVVLAGVFLAGGLLFGDRGGPRVGTVRLNDLTAEFYAGSVRNADSPDAAAQAARDWGVRLERALDAVAWGNGVVLLPVEAVAAGAVDYTAEVRAIMQYRRPPLPDEMINGQPQSGP
ncbi:MAG: TrbI F-type domain-containing protein [Rhodospirillaceae bacterium]|nr:TrbI F-type domain-containing protein [Rhodospirillaceae bacterium]